MAAKKTSAKSGPPTPSLDEILARFAAHPPRGKKPGATSFAKLEKLTAVPESLRSLWSWSNGCAGLLRRDDPRARLGDPIWDNLFSVEIAAKVLDLNRDEGEMKPHLIPFGGETGSGDSLVLDTKTGRVHYWDHEEGDVERDPIATSLAALLARALDSEAAPAAAPRKAAKPAAKKTAAPGR